MPTVTYGQDHDYWSACPIKWSWCRIHWLPVYDFDTKTSDPMRYPPEFNIRTCRNGWVHVTVWCGPAAWLPKKAK